MRRQVLHRSRLAIVQQAVHLQERRAGLGLQQAGECRVGRHRGQFLNDAPEFDALVQEDLVHRLLLQNGGCHAPAQTRGYPRIDEHHGCLDHAAQAQGMDRWFLGADAQKEGDIRGCRSASHFEHRYAGFVGDFSQPVDKTQGRPLARRRRASADEAAKSVAALDHSVRGKVGQRAPNRDAGDTELATQRLFIGQLIAVRIQAAQNLVAQYDKQLAMQRCARGTGQGRRNGGGGLHATRAGHGKIIDTWFGGNYHITTTDSVGHR